MVATDFSRERGYTFAIPAGGDALKIYLDLVVILNFLVDFLLLLGTNRLSGFPASPLRAAAAAAALWLLHRTFPCPLTALLAPANGSPWEMGKLLFWPYLPAALVIWRLSPERGSRGGHCLLLAVMPLCMAGLCWLLPGRWLRLWSLVLAGGLTLHGTVLSRRVPGGELVWYVLAILVGIAYLLLTVGAPDIGPFADPAAAAMGTIPF